MHISKKIGFVNCKCKSSSNLILVTLSVLYAETLQQQNRLPSIDVKVLTKQKASQ